MEIFATIGSETARIRLTDIPKGNPIEMVHDATSQIVFNHTNRLDPYVSSEIKLSFDMAIIKCVATLLLPMGAAPQLKWIREIR